MLNGLHRAYRVKIGSDVSFQDLRAAPTVLIGYSYTRWRDISKELRFFIDAERRPRMVTDNGKPTEWSLPDLPPDRRTSEDYAIVTRVFHPDTQAMLVEVAGITQYGTEAGAELITNPEYLADALHDAPPGWQNKNLQLVLRVKVISGTPASPKVVRLLLVEVCGARTLACRVHTRVNAHPGVRMSAHAARKSACATSSSVEFPNRRGLVERHVAHGNLGDVIILTTQRIAGDAPQHRDLADVGQRVRDGALK